MKKIFLIILFILVFTLSSCDVEPISKPIVTDWETIVVPLNSMSNINAAEYSFNYTIDGTDYILEIDDTLNERSQFDRNDIRTLEVKFDYRFNDGTFEYHDVNIGVKSIDKEVDVLFSVDVSTLGNISSYFKEVDDGIVNDWFFKYFYDGDDVTYDIPITKDNANQIIEDNQEWDQINFTCTVITYFDNSTSLEDCSKIIPIDNLE